MENYHAREKVALAFLDSGLDFDRPEFQGYEIQSFDFTGEGPHDYYGHGTASMLTHIEFQKRLGSDSSKYAIVILNIKIVNKFGETNEVLLLQGLELVSKPRLTFAPLT